MIRHNRKKTILMPSTPTKHFQYYRTSPFISLPIQNKSCGISSTFSAFQKRSIATWSFQGLKTQYDCVIKKRLGLKIAELRKSKGFTQEALAEKADYSVEFISFIERGVHSPSIEGCARIAKALGIPLKDLFTF